MNEPDLLLLRAPWCLRGIIPWCLQDCCRLRAEYKAIIHR